MSKRQMSYEVNLLCHCKCKTHSGIDNKCERVLVSDPMNTARQAENNVEEQAAQCGWKKIGPWWYCGWCASR